MQNLPPNSAGSIVADRLKATPPESTVTPAPATIYGMRLTHNDEPLRTRWWTDSTGVVFTTTDERVALAHASTFMSEDWKAAVRKIGPDGGPLPE